MKTPLLLILFLSCSLLSTAQVGIGTQSPDPSSILDINGDDRGLLVPRMTLSERDAIVNPADGLLIYQLDQTAGFYYYNGTNWVTFGTSGWSLTGNTGTIVNQNYAGTGDNQDLAIGANAEEIVRVLPNGNVGIGTTNPTSPLHIVNQSTPTVIYTQNFEGTAPGVMTEDVTNDPYWINNNLGDFCDGDDAWQVQPNDSNATCTNCAGNRATLARRSPSCEVQATLVTGPFTTPSNSISVSFDYSISLVGAFQGINFRVFLFNEDTQVEDGTLLIREVADLDSSFTINANVTPETSYSLRFEVMAERLDGVTLDNIEIRDNGFSSLRIVDGNEAAGRVLVSDANGNASWEDINTIDFQDDWEFANPLSTSNSDPIFHQGLVKIGDASIAQHTLHVQEGDNIAGTRAFWGSVEFVQDQNGFLEFSETLSSIVSNSTNLGSPSNRWTAVFANNGITSTSDRRLKENINPLAYGLKEVLQLRPISFQWKKEQMDDFIIPENQQETKLGFIAQELLEVLPEMVQTTHWREYEENPGVLQKEEMQRYGVSYSELIPVLVKAIQEQEKQIEALEQQQKRFKKLSEERK